MGKNNQPVDQAGSRKNLSSSRTAEIQADGFIKQLGRWRGHLAVPDLNEPWRMTKWLLLAAFALRTGIALAGDFVIHADEIMQYLEPAHRAVFGSGIVYWEFFHGARSWLVPGFVAAILWLLDAVGLGQPSVYVPVVKIVFCAISVAIPWGMYRYGRSLFGETAGRLALIAGVLWPELIGMAHKPMTEFLATAGVLASLGLLSSRINAGRATGAGILLGLAVCLRLQYLFPIAILAGAAMLVHKRHMNLYVIGGAVGSFVCVGILEWATWGAPFSSYITNFRINLVLDELRAGESSAWLQIAWLAAASAGGIIAALWSLLRHWKKSMPVLLALIVLLITHSLTSHKEYRFIFLAIPLWLIPACAEVAAIPMSAIWKKFTIGLATASYAVLFLANLLPWQPWLYQGFSAGREDSVRFITEQDEIFEVYRFLAEQEDVAGVANVLPLEYHHLPGYYYLHHAVPLYTYSGVQSEQENGSGIAQLATHLIIDRASPPVSGYSSIKTFDQYEVRSVRSSTVAVKPWKDHTVYIIGELIQQLFAQAGMQAKPEPPTYEFASN